MTNQSESTESVIKLPLYVLITPARNEETLIEHTIKSMLGQTCLPLKWIIVNDGSVDGTGKIAQKYAEQFDWIEVVTLPEHRDRTFAGKVHAFNAGFERVKNLEYEVIGNVDADVSFDADYFEFLMARFGENPRLGVAGTIFQSEGYSSGTDSFEGQNHVAGGVQLFRKSCFREIGGYVPNRGGGIDWIAVTTARMVGWTTRSYREKSFYHYRQLGTAERSAFAAAYAYGYKDYCMGAHPLWQFFRVLYRMKKKPYFLEGFGLGLGYTWALLRRAKHPISRELIKFYRKEQMQKLSVIVKSALLFKKVDKFEMVAK